MFSPGFAGKRDGVALKNPELVFLKINISLVTLPKELFGFDIGIEKRIEFIKMTVNSKITIVQLKIYGFPIARRGCPNPPDIAIGDGKHRKAGAIICFYVYTGVKMSLAIFTKAGAEIMARICWPDIILRY